MSTSTILLCIFQLFFACERRIVHILHLMYVLVSPVHTFFGFGIMYVLIIYIQAIIIYL